MTSKTMLSALYQNRLLRFSVVVIFYGLLSTLSVWLAYQLRFDFFVSGEEGELHFLRQIPKVLVWIIPVKLISLAIFRQFSGLLSYFGTPDLYRLMRAIVVASAVIGVVRLRVTDVTVPPRGVILIDFILTAVLLSGFRISCRVIREFFYRPDLSGGRSEAYRIVIIGAGDVGAGLAKELLNKRGLGRLPVAFLDDDRSKHHTRIHNVPVVGAPGKIEDIRQKFRIDEAVIAMPSAPARRLGEIVKELQHLHIPFVTVPSLDQMATGKVRISQLRPVEIQDLLGRAPVSVERDTIRELVDGKIVLVTGAGGSIGSELCRQIASFNPERLLLVEQCEYLLFRIEQELLRAGYGGIVLPLIGNILDEARIDGIHQRYRPEVVFHAAALKHVPMMESQPAEAFKVNSIGTASLARMAIKHEVERFVMISTDKAINPTSVMGATKRLAEMFIQSLAAEEKCPTAFMAVRFGNVLGSSGSVIPTFNNQIANGGPVKVTHPDVTRYFMTIPEAVGLVLQCGLQGAGGEIFVLDMGEPIRIVDLAKQLIELSGFKPGEDIEIEFVGLRPGEKLFEELQHSGENILETEHTKIMRFISEPGKSSEIEDSIMEVLDGIYDVEPSQFKKRLQGLVPEYKPFLQ